MCHSHLYFCITVNLVSHVSEILLFVLFITDLQPSPAVALPEHTALIMTFV